MTVRNLEAERVMRKLFERWLVEEAGQDLIEYALLTAFIALAGAAGFNAISTAINATYGNENQAVQDLWEVPDP